MQNLCIWVGFAILAAQNPADSSHDNLHTKETKSARSNEGQLVGSWRAVSSPADCEPELNIRWGGHDGKTLVAESTVQLDCVSRLYVTGNGTELWFSDAEVKAIWPSPNVITLLMDGGRNKVSFRKVTQ